MRGKREARLANDASNFARGLYLTWPLISLLTSIALCEDAQLDQLASTTLYDQDRSNPWNRLHCALFVRVTNDGRAFGDNELDPLLGEHLLVGDRFNDAVKALDGAVNYRAEKSANEVIKRIVLQRDLWALFDWLADADAVRYVEQRRILRLRIARLILALAPTKREIEDLPDNYAAVVARKTASRHGDEKSLELTGLPPELFDPHGEWVQITYKHVGRIATAHEEHAKGRSTFLLFLKLPEGRATTQQYVEQFNTWADADAKRSARKSGIMHVAGPVAEINYPILPAGTIAALVRKMVVIDKNGMLRPTRLTESVELNELPDGAGMVLVDGRPSRWKNAVFKLNRRHLLDGHLENSLSRLREGEKTFQRGFLRDFRGDPFLAAANRIPPFRGLRTCADCHQTANLLSLGRGGFSLLGIRPANLSLETVTNGTSSNLTWTQPRYEQGVLRGLFDALSESGAASSASETPRDESPVAK